MKRRRAIVVKVEENRIYVMTESRQFRSVPLPPAESLPRPGEIILLPASPWLGTAAMAMASIAAALVIGFYVFSSFFSPVAVAYLELEMNPRLVLSLDSEGMVIDAVPHNDKARSLLDVFRPQGDTVYAACSSAVAAAADLGFLQPGHSHVILATTYPAGDEGPLVVDLQHIEDAVSGVLSQRGIAASLGISSVGKQIAAQARDNGLSVGREMLRIHVDDLGIELPVEDLRDLPLGHIIGRAGVAPPHVGPPVQPPVDPTEIRGPRLPQVPFLEDPREDHPPSGHADGDQEEDPDHPSPWEIEVPGNPLRLTPGRRP